MQLLQFDEAERIGLWVSEAVGAAPTLTMAVARLGGRLRDLLPLSRVSVRSVDVRHGEAAVEAVWSAMPTRLDVGTRMALGATCYPELCETRAPVVGRADETLLESLLAREGVQSWASIPLRRGWTVAGMLSLSSWSPDGLGADTVPFLAELGRSVERRVLELVDLPHVGAHPGVHAASA